MAICSSALRALCRCRGPPSKTLTPFLYHTATIQQWKPAAHPGARRSASSRSSHTDDIPFEDEALPPPVHKAESGRKSTITGSERAAFEKLYKTFNAQGKPRDDDDDDASLHDEVDQIADEYYEDDVDDHDPPVASLDSLFDAVLHGAPGRAASSRQQRHHRRKTRKEEDLATLAEEILRQEREHQKNKSKQAADKEADRIKKAMLKERERVDTLLNNTQTDWQVWEVLEKEVFSLIRSLDLDGLRKSMRGQTSPSAKKRKEDSQGASSSKPGLQKTDSTALPFPTSPIGTLYEAQKPDPARSDPRILFPNYPHHLIVALQVLRTHFPTSSLPLSMIPTMKSLGRSSYALGATTTLYKYLLRTAWLQRSSYSLLTTLLEDMDNGGIEFDYGILSLLDTILREYQMARAGKLGRNLQAVLGMDQIEGEVKRLRAWRDVVSQRLGAWADKRASEGSLVRKLDPKTNEKRRALSKGPRDEIEIRPAKMKTRGIAAGEVNQNVPLVADVVPMSTIENDCESEEAVHVATSTEDQKRGDFEQEINKSMKPTTEL